MHLKGPWQFEWLLRDETQAELPEEFERSGRVKLPATWQSLFGNQHGTVRFQRRFHRPTNLDSWEQVFIVFDGVGGEGAVSVNGMSVGQISTRAESQDFEVTSLLKDGNVLQVDLEHLGADDESAPGGLWAAVAIEIRQDVGRGEG